MSGEVKKKIFFDVVIKRELFLEICKVRISFATKKREPWYNYYISHHQTKNSLIFLRCKKFCLLQSMGLTSVALFWIDI